MPTKSNNIGGRGGARPGAGRKKSAVKDKAALVLCLLVFVLSIFFNISPIVFVVFCAAAGILFTRMGVRGK